MDLVRVELEGGPVEFRVQKRAGKSDKIDLSQAALPWRSKMQGAWQPGPGAELEPDAWSDG